MTNQSERHLLTTEKIAESSKLVFRHLAKVPVTFFLCKNFLCKEFQLKQTVFGEVAICLCQSKGHFHASAVLGQCETGPY